MCQEELLNRIVKNTPLEYSQCKDSSFCFACQHFSLPDTPRSVFTPTEGYHNGKKGTFKFCSHARSQSHITTMLAWAENKIKKKSENMYSISVDCYRCSSSEDVIENQNYIKTLLTATENKAQWGHRESVASDTRGNFLEMLNLVGNHDSVFKRRLEQQAKKKKCFVH